MMLTTVEISEVGITVTMTEESETEETLVVGMTVTNIELEVTLKTEVDVADPVWMAVEFGKGAVVAICPSRTVMYVV